jgi:hypothetical protein
MVTRAMSPNAIYVPVGSMLDPTDPLARIEVCIVDPRRRGQAPIIYVSRYHGAQVETRSVGLSPAIANDVARLLRSATMMIDEAT